MLTSIMLHVLLFFVYWSIVDLQYYVTFVCAPKSQLYFGLANNIIQIFPWDAMEKPNELFVQVNIYV